MEVYFSLWFCFIVIIGRHNARAYNICDTFCTCESTGSNDILVTCTGKNITKIPTDLPANTTKLYFSGTNIKSVQAGAFSIYPLLTELFFRDTAYEPCNLVTLEAGAFDGLDNLMSLGMIGCVYLTSLGPGVLGTFKNLETLHVYRSGLTSIPNLSQFKTLNPDMNGILREIDFRNNRITNIHTDEFFSVKTDYLKLEENQIKAIAARAFRNATIVNLSLKQNSALKEIDENAFDEVALLETLDLSHTSISSLPTKGLSGLRHLILKVTPTLKHFPSVLEFGKIEIAELTYPHHCCAFKNPEKQNPKAWKAKQAQERINKKCALSTTPIPTTLLPVTITSSDSKSNIDMWQSIPLQENQPSIINSNNWQPALFPNVNSGGITSSNANIPPADLFGAFDQHTVLSDITGTRQEIHFELFKNENDTEQKERIESSQSNMFGKFKPDSVVDPGDRKMPPNDNVFHKSTVAVNENLTHVAQCGEIYIYNRNIACTPEPDALNPCEDVMGYVWLRVTVWFVLLAALLGNSVVLIVLTSSRGKFTVPKFLMCNLAFADLMMGVYLILLASIDIHTLGEYFNHAVQWQNEGGCQAAGFLSVFSSELSVFTLTILTLERWYAISHAIHLNKRLRLRQSVALMIFGYMSAITLGLLPLIGISSYGNVSICLPMKTETGMDIGYVVSLLIMNGMMFLAICFCYISMFLSVKGSVTTARSNDATIAKRMSLLVFTNFACWAPIAFFGLTASAGVPLIDITNSKILLVFFYPLNSCANPFLYAILTKQFRKDFFILLGKFGICVERANMYRGTFTSRTLSHSRGLRDSRTHRLHRQPESVLSYLSGSNHSSKHSVNGTPRVHPTRQESSEAQPFIERKSHLDRAAEFANKEPVLGTDDGTLDPWETSDATDLQKASHPTYVRSVSDYVQFNGKRIASGRNGSRVRTSVDTFFSNSTDTTYISDHSHSSDDVWQIRKETREHKNSVKSENEKLLTEPKSSTFCTYPMNEEIPLTQHVCYAISSPEYAEKDSSQRNERSLDKDTHDLKDDIKVIPKTSFKPVNSTIGELRAKFCRSPSLSSLDETNEMSLLAHPKLNAVSGSCENTTTTEFSTVDTIESRSGVQASDA